MSLRGPRCWTYQIPTAEVVILNLFKELKETLLKELEENMILIIDIDKALSIGNSNKEIEIKKRTQWKFWT